VTLRYTPILRTIRALTLFDKNANRTMNPSRGGEKMNKKVLGIAVILMAVAIFVTPVMAISPNKIEVSFEDGAFTGVFPDWELKGDVQHGRNGIMVWEDCDITGDNINLEGGILSKTYNYDINVQGVEPPTPPPNFRFGKGVLHYKTEIVFDDGTFEGNHMVSGEFKVFNSGFVLPWNSDGYAVYHGTGAYRGWKWVMSDVTINGVPQFEGYMLIPKPKLT
jgi:hypothetical protein